jgi:predicted site-specific integrase-resolvase
MFRTTQDSPQLLTTREAAELLGRSAATLKRWRSAGVGPEFIAIEGRISYRREALEQFLEQHTKKPTASLP